MIDVYVHSNDGVDPKLVKTSPESTVKKFLFEALGADDSSSLFREDEDTPLEKDRTLSELEVRPRQHLHLSRCKKVQVSVFYNGEQHETFPPSAKVKRVLKWAIKEFHLSPAEAAEKVLVLSTDKNTELPLDAHIGSFATPGECAVKLCLLAPVEIQG
jgi:hypothetical protein